MFDCFSPGVDYLKSGCAGRCWGYIVVDGRIIGDYDFGCSPYVVFMYYQES